MTAFLSERLANGFLCADSQRQLSAAFARLRFDVPVLRSLPVHPFSNRKQLVAETVLSSVSAGERRDPRARRAGCGVPGVVWGSGAPRWFRRVNFTS